ncbi:cation:proton antiporter [Flagellimonas nanhaiensis]|uniref:Cation:proton antiporter n=1 Tax=Flagellimonas nanhaiensis TaxID=2292706 RepID=A0A371JN26_9FLAO|nr:cation:proton antiporter [Allomuricauda nanhaiensis]RDY58626.1 cation:proton antiporter [Allomuricauda nanhaiensis]
MMQANIGFIELPFFTNLLILLVLARVLGELSERLGQPAMIGEILAGIFLGPSVFNLIHKTGEIATISELGVFLLVVIAGLEIRFDDILRSLKGKNIIISIMAFFLPLLCGFGVGYLFGKDAMVTVFLGLCIAITALPVSIRMLMDMGKLDSEIGKKIISVAIFDDVLALTILGLIINIEDTDKSLMTIARVASVSLVKLLLFLSLLWGAHYVLKRLSKKEHYIEDQLNTFVNRLKARESLYALLFIVILSFAMITESLGFHFIIGAFFAAMLLDGKLIGKTHVEAFGKTTNGMAMSFLSPIFFAGIGLEFSFGSIQEYSLLATVLGISFFSKIMGGYLGSRLSGLDPASAWTIGVGLNGRGIMELVIANIAYASGMIDLEIFSILVIMGIVTTMVTPILLKWSFARLERKP